MGTVIFKWCLILLILHQAAGVKYRYYPRYHLAPPHGWMNDPCGFTYFKGYYHLFFQFNPETSLDPGTAHWGHARSKDLFNWEYLPIAMYPDQSYDKDGVFTGSTLIEDETMYVFYTSQLKFEDGPVDHDNRQCLSTSTDGVNFTKYENNPILRADNNQPEIRDPYVWKKNGTYYMLLGNSYNNETQGRILLYTSADKINWEEASVIGESNGTMGYMWETPNLIVLNDRHVLLFSPQGIKPQGNKYKNLYQNGYMIGTFDYETNMFKAETEFVEIDHGHDHYASQTITTDDGRIVVVSWMDMWETGYPEQADGSTGIMTLPRELTLTDDGNIIQKPIREISAARENELYSGKPDAEISVELVNKAAEIVIEAEICDLEVRIESYNATVSIKYEDGWVSLNRVGNDGERKTEWEPKEKIDLTIYVDASSIEVFWGGGYITFSSRYFPTEDKVTVRLGDNTNVNKMTVTSMKTTVPVPDCSA